MRANIKRGLFRMWLVISMMYIFCMTLLLHEDILESFNKLGNWQAPAPLASKLTPEQEKAVANAKSRQAAELKSLATPQTTADAGEKDPWAEFKPQAAPQTMSDASGEDPWAEFVDFADTESPPDPQAKNNEEQQPTEIYSLLGIIFVPPLATLFIGIALIWAFAGFSTNRQEVK